MQQVGRVLPLNGYLHRIKRHPTGDCPWCPGIKETQLHFQCDCWKFEPHRTTAHHTIAKAVIAALKESTKGWQFYYETPFSALPWDFQWKSYREKQRQQHRRPDGVAWHAEKRLLYFLEFSRQMDYDDSMAAASARKGAQYDEALEAVMRAQRRGTYGTNQVASAATLPLLFGVRGSVEYADISEWLAVFRARSVDRVLAAGVRATLEASTAMITARRAALSSGEDVRSRSDGARRRQRGGRRQRRQPRLGGGSGG